MSRNGSGTYSLPTGNPVIEGTAIDPAVHNTTLNDIAAEITNSLARDGQAAMTGPLDMGSEKIKNLETGTLRSDAVNLGQVQDGSFQYVATVGGTANAITLTPSPSISAYVAGQGFSFKVGSANTGATTVAVSGLSAKSLTKRGTTALVSGDLPANALVYIQYDGTQFQVDRVADVATRTGTETLTNKTLTSPTINGGALSGTFTGSPTFGNTTVDTLTANAAAGSVRATQAQMEAAASNDVLVTPNIMHYHPLMPKAWALITYSGTTPQAVSSVNINSISGGGTGTVTFNFSQAFSTLNYGVLTTVQESGAVFVRVDGKTTSSCDIKIFGESSGTFPAVNRSFFVAFFGDI